MQFLLLITLLSPGATAPSLFTVNGYATEAGCERARGALVAAHRPYARRVTLWAVCFPSNDGPAPSMPLAPAGPLPWPRAK